MSKKYKHQFQQGGGYGPAYGPWPPGAVDPSIGAPGYGYGMGPGNPAPGCGTDHEDHHGCHGAPGYGNPHYGAAGGYGGPGAPGYGVAVGQGGYGAPGYGAAGGYGGPGAPGYGGAEGYGGYGVPGQGAGAWRGGYGAGSYGAAGRSGGYGNPGVPGYGGLGYGAMGANRDFLQGMSALLPSHHTEQFLMGLMIGAGAAWLLSDEELRGKLIKAGMKLYANVAGGFEELKEQMADIRAEVAAEQHGDDGDE